MRDNDPVLRTVAARVKRVDADIRRLMDDMVETMRLAPGVGLAAPQVGVSKRVIVVEIPLDGNDITNGTRLWQLADPEILWRSESQAEDQEACLSIPDIFGDVPRHTAIRVRARNKDGKLVEIEASDFEARVLQHEIDHLDGVLFIDRVTSLDKLYRIREDESGELVRVPYAVPAL